MKRIVIAVLLVLSGVRIAQGDPGDTVVLYQPDAVVGQRLSGDVETLATFILKCQDCWAQVTTNPVTRSRTALVVAIGVGRQSAGWIVGLAGTNADEVISRKLITLPTPHLTEGFIAFAVLGKDHETELKRQKAFAPPCPITWKQVAEKQTKPMSTDDILDVLLPKGPEAKPTADKIGKPIVHNHIAGKATAMDEVIHKAFAASYTVVDLKDPSNYTSPKPVAGGLPSSPKTATGERLNGYVLIGYIVSTEGRAIEPTILKSTDERLSRIALNAVQGWRFEPAQLNGTAISTTAAQQFHFGDK